MKSIIYIFCIFCSFQGYCQEKWQNKINSFKINNGVVLQKADSNAWFVISNTKSFTLGETKSEVVLIRYDECGNIRWSYRYGIDSASLTMTDAITDNGENIVITGYYSVPDDQVYNGKSFMMKLSPSGMVYWIKAYNLRGADYVYAVSQTNDGNYFIFSNRDNLGGAQPFNALCKISMNGNLIWYKMLADNPIWGSALSTSDGGMLIRSGNLIYKLNAFGNVVWANNYSNIRYTTKPIEVGNQYIFASFPSSSDSVSYLFSLSTNGLLNWISPSFTSSSIKSFKALSNGNLLATASIQTLHSSSSKICFTEFAMNGNILQQQTIDASTQQLPTYGSDFIELDNQALLFAALERSGSNDSLVLMKSRQLTDFSCSQNSTPSTLPLQQIIITPAGISSFDLINEEHPLGITKNAITTRMTMHCFVPDNNSIHLGNDTTLCPNQHLVLNSGLGANYRHLWSTGATTASITVLQAGTYWVKAFLCDTIYDTIVVKYASPLVLNYRIRPLLTNPYTPVHFENFTQGYAQLNWQTGDGSVFTSDIFQHQYLNGGIYYPLLSITDFNGCIYSSQEKVIVNEVTFYVPNSFSPNGDGSNDLFIPKCTGVERYEMFIYSRWGEEVFSAVNRGWDGKINDKVEAKQGVYNYKILIQDIFGIESIKSGSVTLFR